MPTKNGKPYVFSATVTVVLRIDVNAADYASALQKAKAKLSKVTFQEWVDALDERVSSAELDAELELQEGHGR